MSQSQWKKVEDHIIKVLIGAAGVSICTAFVFYFNTNHVMAMHGKDIDELKAATESLKKSVNTIKVVPTLNKQEIAHIKENVRELKENMKDVKKTQEEMLRLLYKIDKK